MTSAPKSDSTVVAPGAAMKLLQSMTRKPSKIEPMSVSTLPLFRDQPRLAASLSTAIAWPEMIVGCQL